MALDLIATNEELQHRAQDMKQLSSETKPTVRST